MAVQVSALFAQLRQTPLDSRLLDALRQHCDETREFGALAEALVGRTSLVIAHRLSTITSADQILVLENGETPRARPGEILVFEGGVPVRVTSRPVTVNGVSINSAMPPLEGILSDWQIADVLSYVYNAWGNEGAAFKPAEVKAIRQKNR